MGLGQPEQVRRRLPAPVRPAAQPHAGSVLVLVADGQLAVLVADADDGAVADVAAEQGAPDPGLDLAADEPAQRPRPVDRVVALRAVHPSAGHRAGRRLGRQAPLSFPPPQYARSRYLPTMVTPVPWWPRTRDATARASCFAGRRP